MPCIVSDASTAVIGAVTTAHAATVAKLKKGDKVRLEWDHNYVTRTENGGESKYPERVITMIEPVA